MIVTHPNRDKPVVQATRATVIVLLLASAALVLIVTVGGWSVLEGAIPVQIGYVVVYVTLAFYAGRWNRGVLPVASALAGAAGDLRAGRRARLVQPRQKRLRPADARTPACSGC